MSDTQRVNQPGREEGIVRAGAHPIEHERPEEWGWHGETGRLGRIGAWFAVIVLLLLLVGNDDNFGVAQSYVVGIAAILVIILLWDMRRRKNAWRSR